MAIFKCKMCGGTIEFEQGASIGVCDSCGTKQTLPRLDDDKKANLYDRANHFRRNNEFDKAMEIYEKILNEDNQDAESYWSLVLCRYGIEYVDDPATHKKVPTVNRAQYTSIFDDEDYKSALKYADGYQKTLYEEEANQINEIQKGILAISQKEEPFDVFICYKETDNNGRRTQDSVLANDLYHQLTQEGFKVFFSRITLEDKLGVAYEPYIFAALNSSKVMVVIGTKPEYFNAVWVKNEWSRYLALIKNGAKKILIPAYRDMDPYDLPEEFSHLQAQDMSKLGFMQDLIRGIKKIATTDEPKTTVKETVVVSNNDANTAPLLERVFLFLEDGKWQDANIYSEKVLDIDPKNAEAYLGKLMAELQVTNRKKLADCAESFDENDNYSKILRFGDEKLEEEMRGYITHINERNENTRITNIYNNAVNEMKSANDENRYKSIAEMFKSISGFKDADTLANECLEKAEACRKDDILRSAKDIMESKTISAYEDAIRQFQSISGWKDADEQIYACQRKIEEIKAKEEADRIEAERKAEEIKCIINRINQIKSQINTEKEKLSSLGLLAFGKKKEIQERIIELRNKLTIEDKNCENLLSMMSINQQIALNSNDLYFGHYSQANNSKKQLIKWRLLDKQGSKVLIISEYALDCKQYNTNTTPIKWESCSIRKWLNNDFINEAFSSKEQSLIQTTNISADKNPKYDTYPGSATTDKVFLLSIPEVEKYFTSDEDRKCVPTEYAKAQGAWTSDDYTKGGKATCWWWLRSPGNYQDLAASVRSDGSVNYYGRSVYNGVGCVRPALWISLE